MQRSVLSEILFPSPTWKLIRRPRAYSLAWLNRPRRSCGMPHTIDNRHTIGLPTQMEILYRAGLATDQTRILSTLSPATILKIISYCVGIHCSKLVSNFARSISSSVKLSLTDVIRESHQIVEAFMLEGATKLSETQATSRTIYFETRSRN